MLSEITAAFHVLTPPPAWRRAKRKAWARQWARMIDKRRADYVARS